MRAALLVAATLAAGAGCRSIEPRAATGEWSCGAVHGDVQLRRRLGGHGRLRLGALADSNGTAATTMANLKRFAGVFADEHVDAVLALGDLGRNEEEIATVLGALAAAHAPVLALAGERDPEYPFHEAIKRARNGGLDIVDLVDKRLIDTGEIDIVAAPGYPFSRSGCHYDAADLQALQRLATGRFRPLLLAAHTPPRGDGAAAPDWATGNVNAGDPVMLELVDALYPNATLFAHVDEAGGRTQRGRINVGGVERGMAAIVEIADGNARHRVLQ